MAAQEVKINSTEFQPRNEYMLIQAEAPDFGEKKTEGGIIIPAQQQVSINDSRPSSGTVVSVGKDIDDIAVGDFVLWPNTDGLDLEFLDGPFILMRNQSVIGKKK